jgi:16S rRNA (cytidine1402-2'-O)-methyltransferase
MLSIIPTPIWNKEDITLRALRLLNEIDTFFAEDPNTTKKLMMMYDIDYKNPGKKRYKFNSFLTDKQREHYIEIAKTQNVGLVCEAGTPGLSDPAKEFIKQCWIHDIPFEVLPGATALIPAVISSNWNTTQFWFWGFLPKKKGKQTTFQKIIASEYPIYVYESVHRIEKTLEEIQKAWFVWQVMICRELTKMHEQYVHGTIPELLEKIRNNQIPMKWEFVLGFCN